MTSVVRYRIPLQNTHRRGGLDTHIGMTMDIVHRFGYLAVGVSNLAEATEFYSRFVRIDLTERVGSTPYMTGGLDHHWVRLEEGSGQGIKRIGYEVTCEESFPLVRASLRNWGRREE